MNIKSLFKSATEKQNELWNHDIISSKKDLKDWLAYEKKPYANECSWGGGYDFLSNRKRFYLEISKAFA